jgi:hypothetical protein
MTLVPFAVKLARYHDRLRADVKKAQHVRQRRRMWAAKRKAKAQLRAVLKMARQALGYKPLKLSPAHHKALAEGRDRYHQARREARSKTDGVRVDGRD